MNGYVKGRQLLIDDPFKIEFGETCKRRVIAVQERKSEIVVFHIERFAEAFRKLVDEIVDTR